MKSFMAALLAAFAFASPSLSSAQDAPQGKNPVAQLPWEIGPATGSIGGRATIKVPEGYGFLGAEGTKQLNVILQNPDTGQQSWTLAPEDLGWVAFFTFSDVGYVKDGETLDADEILSSVKAGTEQANEERRRNGWETMNVTGWSFKPKYDATTKALEWAILAESEKNHEKVVNYNTRLLGRKGVMEVVVVSSPEDLAAATAAFKTLLPGYAFTQGEAYADYRDGDHVAAYGLAALITGGAAAVAAKKGVFGAIAAFFAAAWKFLLAGLLGLGAWLKSLFSGRRKDGKPAP